MKRNNPNPTIKSTAAETEAAKEQARSWDRSQLLAVDEGDAQVKIYQAYAENANTNADKRQDQY